MAALPEDLLAELTAGLTEPDRAARARLLHALAADGVPHEELREAVHQGRLVLLPLERALRTAGPRTSVRRTAEQLDVPVEVLQRMRETLGLPAVDLDDEQLTQEDVEAIGNAAAAMRLGVPPEGVLEINGVLADGMSALAATLRQIGVQVFAPPGAEEAELAQSLAGAVELALPTLIPVLEYALRVHLVQQVTGDFVEQQALSSGLLGQARAASVAFADLVGFTRLSDSADGDAGALGSLNQRLTALARRVAVGRVRLVKTIGDAVMLTAPTPAELASAVLDLLSLADADPTLPELRAAMAHGDVLVHGGDVFGRPVNLASRLTSGAEVGGLSCDTAAAAVLDGDAAWSVSLVRRERLAGLAEPQERWAVRRASAP